MFSNESLQVQQNSKTITNSAVISGTSRCYVENENDSYDSYRSIDNQSDSYESNDYSKSRRHQTMERIIESGSYRNAEKYSEDSQTRHFFNRNHTSEKSNRRKGMYYDEQNSQNSCSHATSTQPSYSLSFHQNQYDCCSEVSQHEQQLLSQRVVQTSSPLRSRHMFPPLIQIETNPRIALNSESIGFYRDSLHNNDILQDENGEFRGVYSKSFGQGGFCSDRFQSQSSIVVVRSSDDSITSNNSVETVSLVSASIDSLCSVAKNESTDCDHSVSSPSVDDCRYFTHRKNNFISTITEPNSTRKTTGTNLSATSLGICREHEATHSKHLTRRSDSIANELAEWSLPSAVKSPSCSDSSFQSIPHTATTVTEMTSLTKNKTYSYNKKSSTVNSSQHNDNSSNLSSPTMPLSHRIYANTSLFRSLASLSPTTLSSIQTAFSTSRVVMGDSKHTSETIIHTSHGSSLLDSYCHLFTSNFPTKVSDTMTKETLHKFPAGHKNTKSVENYMDINDIEDDNVDAMFQQMNKLLHPLTGAVNATKGHTILSKCETRSNHKQEIPQTIYSMYYYRYFYCNNMKEDN